MVNNPDHKALNLPRMGGLVDQPARVAELPVAVSVANSAR